MCRKKKIFLLIIAWTWLNGISFSKSFSESELLKQQTKKKVTGKVTSLLEQYCKSFCKFIDAEVYVAEEVPYDENLGFEVITDESKVDYFVEKIILSIQVDNRITTGNQEKIKNLLQKQVSKFARAVDIFLQTFDPPNIEEKINSSEKIKSDLRDRIETEAKKIFSKFCPNQCILSKIMIDATHVDLDKEGSERDEEVFYSNEKNTAIKVNKIDLELTLDENLVVTERNNIIEILKAKTKFVSPINIETILIPFPETFHEKQMKIEKESDDPYGLEKLRRMLIMFRDLAGTKEVISKTQETNSNQYTADNDGADNHLSWLWYLTLLMVVMIIFFYIFNKINKANEDSRLMVSRMQHLASDEDNYAEQDSTQENENPENDDDFKDNIIFAELRKELTDAFINSPSVAKETFSRMLTEGGVEETSKYVDIFGKIVTFELTKDPNFQRNLYDLSEYYHKCNFNFTIKEKIELLRMLKIKVTAHEIKVLARKNMDQFEFLNRLDPQQIYKLMHEEKTQIQSIILTQISPKNRKKVFEMFEGDQRSELMNELGKTDSIPKEFLYNVASALKKKVKSKPEFDAQSVRSVDIMLELLEKTNIQEQKYLMKNLSENNPEAERLLKMKLVTIETLTYLKDGQLLELVLDLEPEILLNFLGGAPAHICNLLLSHVPEELADSWREELEVRANVDEQQYRAVEIKIIGKVRTFANNGSINLLEINERIFDRQNEEFELEEMSQMGNPNLVA